MRHFLRSLRSWLPYPIWNSDPRRAFTLAHDAAAPGTRTFHAFGITVHWTFLGFIVARHRPHESDTRSHGVC
jgi:hypothetical protein